MCNVGVVEHGDHIGDAAKVPEDARDGAEPESAENDGCGNKDDIQSNQRVGRALDCGPGPLVLFRQIYDGEKRAVEGDREVHEPEQEDDDLDLRGSDHVWPEEGFGVEILKYSASPEFGVF